MKKLLPLLVLSAVLCSCSGGLNEQEKKEKLNYKITSENYGLFFKVEHSLPNKKTTITPLYNKHISYKNVVFNFKTDYSITSSRTVTYNYSVTIDETGNGQASNIDTTSYTTSTDYQFVSVEGTVSFNEDYTTFDQIEKVKRDSLHKEDVGVYYNFSGSTQYKIVFKADLNVSETSDTDAFYLIESVKVKFKATVNNVAKEFEYVFYPNFYGIAEIPVEEKFDSLLENRSYSYTNGYYLAY